MIKLITQRSQTSQTLFKPLNYSPFSSFNLEAVSPIDGRYLSSTEILKDYFSEYALMKYRTKIEVSWVQHIVNKGIAQHNNTKISLDKNQIGSLNKISEEFDINSANRIKEIEKVTNHDVKAVEYYVKEQITKENSIEFLKEYVHFSCTSEDINNLSYSLMMNDANQLVMCRVLNEVLDKLQEFAIDNQNQAMLSRTHGQSATPTTVGKEIANFGYRIGRQFEQIKSFEFPGKLNGAVGNFNAHILAYPEFDWPSISREFIENLNLEYNPYTTQIEPHDKLANYYSLLSQINTIMIDLSRDMWGYMSFGYFMQKLKQGEVGSSTMPHKVNPIDFENCEGNLGLANSLNTHFVQKLPISRYQRDLSDSTVMRNTGTSLAYSLIGYKSLLKGLGKLTVNKQKIEQDLDDHWEVLAEPIQTVMRKYDIDSPYEKLKALTRGNKIHKEDLVEFVKTLQIPDQEKTKLLQLEPRTYLGNAIEMANFKKYLKL